MRDFRKLKVMDRAHRLALSVYEHSVGFPKSEIYGLTSQIRRAATSVPTNIAEGCGRQTVIEFARFLHIATGSATELEYLLMLARDLGFLTETAHALLVDETTQVKSMLTALIKRLRLKPSGDQQSAES